MFKLKFSSRGTKAPTESIAEMADLDDVEFCYKVLHKVSRSFAVVISRLHQELNFPICLFYLILRGLDSVEDDMDFPIEQKSPLLRSFYQVLDDPDWCHEACGDTADYRALMKLFYKVNRAYKTIKPEYQVVIRDITKRMGNGMADYAEKMHETGTGSIISTDDYNLYCHYVAGLVGIGLTDLFACSNLEHIEVSKATTTLSNNMGLFLQKTNITRDYLEDLDSGRTWWPREVWSLYSDELSWFSKNPEHPKTIACLNHLIYDALSLVPDVLAYISLLKTDTVFEFCAIPQVMAIATLAEIYDNVNVFKGVVKIRKGTSAYLMLNSSTMESVKEAFYKNITKIRDIAYSKLGQSPDEEHILQKTIDVCDQMLVVTAPEVVENGSSYITSTIAVVAVTAIAVTVANRYK